MIRLRHRHCSFSACCLAATSVSACLPACLLYYLALDRIKRRLQTQWKDRTRDQASRRRVASAGGETNDESRYWSDRALPVATHQYKTHTQPFERERKIEGTWRRRRRLNWVDSSLPKLQDVIVFSLFFSFNTCPRSLFLYSSFLLFFFILLESNQYKKKKTRRRSTHICSPFSIRLSFK